VTSSDQYGGSPVSRFLVVERKIGLGYDLGGIPPLKVTFLGSLVLLSSNWGTFGV
jgi:hypothetical protein